MAWIVLPVVWFLSDKRLVRFEVFFQFEAIKIKSKPNNLLFIYIYIYKKA